MRRTGILWGIAFVMVVAVVVLYAVAPGTAERSAAEAAAAELTSIIAKANTYFEFGHFDRAADSYAEAADAGMSDGAGWYEYAVALERTSGRDLQVYLTAYELLHRENPNHNYFAEVERVIAEESVEFDYGAAAEGELPENSLVIVTGTVARVDWGRVSEGTDTVIVATRPDLWLGHSGDEILSLMPRDRRLPVGQQVVIVGWFDGWTTATDQMGFDRRYPSIDAAGVRPIES